MDKKVLHGFYSVKQSKVTGVVVYKTPDGKEVEVTSVHDDRNNHGIMWDDVAYIGVVSSYVKRISEAQPKPDDETLMKKLNDLVNGFLPPVKPVEKFRWN